MEYLACIQEDSATTYSRIFCVDWNTIYHCIVEFNLGHHHPLVLMGGVREGNANYSSNHFCVNQLYSCMSFWQGQDSSREVRGESAEPDVSRAQSVGFQRKAVGASEGVGAWSLEWKKECLRDMMIILWRICQPGGR